MTSVQGDVPEPLRVGVLGLGRMGLPIALRLRAAGHHVVGYDPDPVRRAQLPDLPVSTPPIEPAPSSDPLDPPDPPDPLESPDPLVPNWAKTSREARLGTSGGLRGWERDVVLTVLPGPRELTLAMAGDDGALEGLREGALWVDLTSGDPRVARALARRAAERGVHAVGAPMAGGPADAEAGTLGFFVGGEPAAVDRALPLLASLGDADRLERAGDDVGAGHVAKLLANTLWFGQVAAVVEALLIGRAQGIEPEQLAAILRRSAGGSAFLDRHLDALLDGDYLETFGIDRVVEELDTVTGLAADAGLSAELTHLVARLHHEALDAFGPVAGELLVAKLLEQRAGMSIRRASPATDHPSTT
ncbi:NAD(P)-dependent oxidoreductase [Herbiconiux sp. CPCC 205763]|uniref:NAD(P)-dependent oxidoreductase n=1 Tax=Herbiconiux aconitum TaxID=2970913 RepID=A0ABT2GQK0_9MICO|nr:NAD(P)-dependent oxidoreductase [Herbiconiux aconitum]MCS5717570.1 NAD(P)-dependent oxidoreductase [Herbiconiux aconitum]